ncbi:MAG: family 43 glycosylhydrolase [Sedimentisphaerales bacterium]|nr:family 43 glycosylhydrolase [Sedimentisphaerales bacterium]
MKVSSKLHIFTILAVTLNLFIASLVVAASEEYETELEKYAERTKAVSGGYKGGNRVFLQVGGHKFFDYDAKRIELAGIYVIALRNNKVLLRHHYNTYQIAGASIGFAHDIDKLPSGTFVVIAAKDEPTKLFDEDGQKALYQIGAEKGLLNQEFRTSYLCIGIKGLARGKAIEKAGMEELKHIGQKVDELIEFTFPGKIKPKQLSSRPGQHEGLMFGDTEVIYYIPENFNPKTTKYLFGIHGAGDWHRPGALNRITQFKDIADIENLVVIAPVFDNILNWPVNRERDLDEESRFKDQKIIKDRYLWDFVALLNKFNEQRSDLKLIEIFEFFNENLMRREKFYLCGHSGGGQFVTRFITFHSELVDKVCASSPGTFTFPYRDKDYPWGLKMDNLEKTFGSQIKADDLHLNDEQLDQKMDQLLDLQLFLIAGEEETNENHTDLTWQGKGTLHKTRNYFEAMKEEDKRLKDKGIRPQSKPFKFELHVMSGVGHDSAASAKKTIELLFPSEKNPSIAPTNSDSSKYSQILREYADRTKVVSGGLGNGNQVLIQIDDYPFYISVPNNNTTAGLYVVAVKNNHVLLQSHYNTFFTPQACKNFLNDIDRLPDGTFVVVAAKDEPTHLFDEDGQKALYKIGAKKGLFHQEFRTSYLCLGVKGLDKGQAIEQIGMRLLEHIGADINKPARFIFQKKDEPAVMAGMFKIYDPSIGENKTWSINDHCFIRGKDGIWHMFGILGIEPHAPITGRVFAHATAKSFTQIPWVKGPDALKVDSGLKETHLWAPHIIYHNGIFYMYYCAGGKDRTKYKIHLATSKDLERWHRHPENPMVVDGFDARDPFILRVGNEWVMYYTATSTPSGGEHIVAYQTSQDLIHWHNRRIAFRDTTKGTGGGPTESPVVVRRGEYYYLFIGPRGGYIGTDIFRSRNPFKWEIADKVGHIMSHAAEVIRDVDGKWYVSHCGFGQGGVYLSNLYWNDSQNDNDTSLPIPE